MPLAEPNGIEGSEEFDVLVRFDGMAWRHACMRKLPAKQLVRRDTPEPNARESLQDGASRGRRRTGNPLASVGGAVDHIVNLVGGPE